jgi:hypothetical protein
MYCDVGRKINTFLEQGRVDEREKRKGRFGQERAQRVGKVLAQGRKREGA